MCARARGARRGGGRERGTWACARVHEVSRQEGDFVRNRPAARALAVAGNLVACRLANVKEPETSGEERRGQEEQGEGKGEAETEREEEGAEDRQDVLGQQAKQDREKDQESNERGEKRPVTFSSIEPQHVEHELVVYGPAGAPVGGYTERCCH